MLYIVILLGILILLISFSKNKPFHLVVLIFFAVFSRDYIPVADIQIAGLFKIWDTVILWLLLIYFLSPATTLYAQIPAFYKNVLIIWAVIFFISIINSLSYQNTTDSIKSYRAALWLMTPFVINKFLATRKAYDLFLKFLIYLVLAANCIYILQTIFPTIPFIPNISVAESDFGGRVYGFSLILNNIIGIYCLCLFFVKNEKKYLWIFLITLAAIGLSLGRSGSVGYLVAIVVVVIYIKKYYYKKLFSSASFKMFFINVMLIIVLVGSFGIYQIFEKRYVDNTLSQYESEDNQFLTGRWAKFERRYNWLEKQGAYFNYFGVGRLQPTFEREWDLKTPKDNMLESWRVADSYMGCESGYLNVILSYGLIGGWVIIGTFFLMIRHAIKSLKKESNVRIESIVSIAAMLYLVFQNISANFFDEVNSFFQFGLIILMLSPKRDSENTLAAEIK